MTLEEIRQHIQIYLSIRRVNENTKFMTDYINQRLQGIEDPDDFVTAVYEALKDFDAFAPDLETNFKFRIEYEE